MAPVGFELPGRRAHPCEQTGDHADADQDAGGHGEAARQPSHSGDGPGEASYNIAVPLATDAPNRFLIAATASPAAVRC